MGAISEIWGWDEENSEWVKLLVDDLGHAQVDVLTAPLPTGAATETTLVLLLLELVDKLEAGDLSLEAVTKYLNVVVKTCALPADAATETTLALILTAVQLIDNFISGARGLVTEDNSAAILAKFVPLAKAAQHSVAETADTDILASALTPTNTPCLFRIMVMLETAGVFSAMLSDGIQAKKLKLNAGTALTANCAYIFDILVHSGDTVNFQTSASGNVTLRVQEIVGGVQ